MSTSFSRRPTVAVVGDGIVEPADPRYLLARELGRRLVDAGFVVVTGGLGGIMAAACEGARSAASWAPGATVGILPGHDPSAANPWVDVAIPTGLEVARNVVVAHADALVAVGGGAGTLSEIAVAWQLGRLVLAFRVEGWSGRLADRRVDARVRYPDIPDDRVYGVNEPEDAVAWLLQRLPAYGRR